MRYGLEFTTNIGCPVGCLKYCPQEVTVKNYGKSNRVMSYAGFLKILDNTPKSVTLIYAGFSEPFANPRFGDMLAYSAEQGYNLILFTTLYGVSDRDVSLIHDLKFERLCLHLPDGVAMMEPKTVGYRDHVFDLLGSKPGVEVMNMGANFHSNNRENTARGLYNNRRKFQYCERLNSLRVPVVLPNGDAYLCCMDFGLEAKVGNLISEKYCVVDRRVRNYGLCEVCSMNRNLLSVTFFNTVEKVRKNVLKRS